jgi:hypothetical protein
MMTHPLDMPHSGKDVNELARHLAIYFGARELQQHAVALRPGIADVFGLHWQRWYDIRPMMDGTMHSAGDIALRQAALTLLECCKRIERHAEHPHYVRMLTAEPDDPTTAAQSTVAFAATRITGVCHAAG